MGGTHSKRLMDLAKEILNAERKAKDIYQRYVRIIKDESIKQELSNILRDEEEHIQLATEVLSLLQYGSDYSKVIKGLDVFTEASSLLILCGVENYFKVNRIILKYLINEKGFRCIYVTINKPSTTLREAFKREDIHVNNLFFIDCTTINMGIKGTVIAKPENLSDISMKIGRLVRKIKEEKFVYLDTVSTLYIFHPTNIVERFIHHIISRLKMAKSSFIMVAVKEEMDKRSMAVLKSFVDHEIKL